MNTSGSAMTSPALSRFIDLVVRRRWTVAVAATVLMLAMTGGARFTGITNDNRSLFDEDNPQIAALDALEETYASSNTALVAVAPREGPVFTRETLAAISDYPRGLLDEARASHPDLAYHLTGDVILHRTFADVTRGEMETLAPIVFLIIVVAFALLLHRGPGPVDHHHGPRPRVPRLRLVGVRGKLGPGAHGRDHDRLRAPCRLPAPPAAPDGHRQEKAVSHAHLTRPAFRVLAPCVAVVAGRGGRVLARRGRERAR